MVAAQKGSSGAEPDLNFHSSFRMIARGGRGGGFLPQTLHDRPLHVIGNLSARHSTFNLLAVCSRGRIIVLLTSVP